MGSLFGADVPELFWLRLLQKRQGLPLHARRGCWVPVSCWWLCWWQALSHRGRSPLLPFCLPLRWEGREVVICCRHYSVFSGKAILACKMCFSSKEGLCVTLKEKKKKDRCSSWSSTVTRRADGRWRGRRAAPPPLAPASCFYGSNETVPFPKQAPGLHVYLIPGPTTPKAACQPHWPSRGNMAGFIPDYCTAS